MANNKPTNVEHLPTVASPAKLLEIAVTQGNIEVIARVMDLQERWEKNQARKAFDGAVADAKAEMPIIVKEREMNAGQGRTSYKYEDMAAIARAIDPVLAKHGLSYRFRTATTDKGVLVTCIVSHRDGHSEENSLSAANDTSGSKNAIQALGSTVTYLQRYTLKAALGLAASVDDDVRAVGNGDGSINDEQLTKLRLLISDVGGARFKNLEERVLTYTQINGLDQLPARRFDEVCGKIEGQRAMYAKLNEKPL